MSETALPLHRRRAIRGHHASDEDLRPGPQLRFRLYGDDSGSGYGLYLTDASGETHKYRDNSGKAEINFQGWKEIVFDLDAGREPWGGNNDGKLDYPLSDFTFEVSTPGKAVESDLFFDAVSVNSDAAAEDTLDPPKCRCSRRSTAPT